MGRHQVWLGAVALGLSMALGVVGAGDDKAQERKIARLIEQLGNGTFEEREQAGRALEAIGAPALPALQKAIKGDDLETRRRALVLVQRIEKSAAAASIQTPTKVHLNFKDTPLPEAITELSKCSGFDIMLGKSVQKPAQRRISLDTGETTFWNALEQLCRAGGLVEEPPPLEPEVQRGTPHLVGEGAPPPARPVTRVLKNPPAGRGAGTIASRLKALRDYVPTRITLVDGHVAPAPADTRSVVRIQPVRIPSRDTAAPEGQLELVLEARPEPNIYWFGPTHLRITQAVDDKGQALQVVPSGAAQPAGPRRFGAGGAPLRSVFLKKGESEPQSMKELSGVIGGLLSTRPTPVMTVEDLLKATGKTVQGPAGGSLTVEEVSRDDSDRVSIRLKLIQSQGMKGETTGDMRFKSQNWVKNAGAQYTGTFNGIGLRDEQGRAVPFHALREDMNSGPIIFKIVCPPAADHGLPTQLVYICRKQVAVEIPFTLHDVPLR